MERRLSVYFLKYIGSIIYVGQTLNPAKRLQQHKYDVRRKTKHPLYRMLADCDLALLFLEVVSTHGTKALADKAEERLIKHHKPFGNLTRGGAKDDIDAAQSALAWRKANPKEAYKQSRRASRIAARGKTKAKVKPINRVARRKAHQAAAKKLWKERTPEQRAALSAAISAGMKKANAALSESVKQQRLSQLSEARKAIDHEHRKERQREGIAAYWNRQ